MKSISFSLLSISVICVLATSCQQRYRQGQAIYKTYCANCHMEDGSGLGMLIPPLNGADFIAQFSEQVPCIIRYGSNGGLTVNGTVFQEAMPSFTNLNEVELSNLINYLHTAWDNDLPETSPAAVSGHLEHCVVE